MPKLRNRPKVLYVHVGILPNAAAQASHGQVLSWSCQASTTTRARQTDGPDSSDKVGPAPQNAREAARTTFRPTGPGPGTGIYTSYLIVHNYTRGVRKNGVVVEETRPAEVRIEIAFSDSGVRIATCGS
jgi:hypothetical protein